MAPSPFLIIAIALATMVHRSTGVVIAGSSLIFDYIVWVVNIVQA